MKRQWDTVTKPQTTAGSSNIPNSFLEASLKPSIEGIETFKTIQSGSVQAELFYFVDIG